MLKKSINIRTFKVEIEINSNREIAPMTSTLLRFSLVFSKPSFASQLAASIRGKIGTKNERLVVFRKAEVATCNKLGETFFRQRVGIRP